MALTKKQFDEQVGEAVSEILHCADVNSVPVHVELVRWSCEFLKQIGKYFPDPHDYSRVRANFEPYIQSVFTSISNHPKYVPMTLLCGPENFKKPVR